MTPMDIFGALCIALVFVLFAAWVITDLGELADEMLRDELWDDDWDRENMRVLDAGWPFEPRPGTVGEASAPLEGRAPSARKVGGRYQVGAGVGPQASSGGGAVVFPREWVLRRPVLFDQDNDAA